MKKKIIPLLKYLILGITLFFLFKTLASNWDKITLEIAQIGKAEQIILAFATGVTLLAHTWSGLVWTWIIKEFDQRTDSSGLIPVYLHTNLAKYLPGNVWHYILRVNAATKACGSTAVAAVSVILEPLLMAAAALITVLVGGIFVAYNTSIWVVIAQVFALAVVLCGIHPWVFNPIVIFLQRLKIKKNQSGSMSGMVKSVRRYPLLPLLGEIGFLGLRSIGFILTLYAIGPVDLNQLPLLVGAFSFSWLLGLVTPGAPGGLGIFEVTAITILQYTIPEAQIVTATILYRIISIIAESAAAGLSWLDRYLFA